MAEKTEKATPKKLRDARKKGQVAKSQDFPSAFTFVVSIAATLFSAGYLFEQLAGFMVPALQSIRMPGDITDQIGGFQGQSMLVIFNRSLPIAVIPSLIGVL